MRFWGSLWEALGTPFGTLLRPFWSSRPILEALGGRVGGILDPFGHLSVSTSFLDPQNNQKLSFVGVADVAEV